MINEDLRERIHKWRQERNAIGERENNGERISAAEYEGSDEWAVELLDEVFEALGS